MNDYDYLDDIYATDSLGESDTSNLSKPADPACLDDAQIVSGYGEMYDRLPEDLSENLHEGRHERLPVIVSVESRRTEKRRRRGLRTAMAIVCCLALMLGSGIVGARIIEGRYGTLQESPGIAQPQPPVSGIQGGSDSSNANANASVGSDSSDSAVEHLGGINPGGDTLSLTELFIGADPAVVAISTEMSVQNAFGRPVTYPAAGSGFIISQDGYIVTNNHVIEDATSISVMLSDGTVYSAELVGRDPVSDLAVLKIEASGLSYLTWGNSGTLLVGEQVAAIGNALGEFANSMTVGYVSALDREINIDGTPRNMLQTDAAVNSGNSGGPLLNLSGQVIGVVTAKSIGSDVEGLGFAIPSDKAEAVVRALIDIGTTEGFGYVRAQAVMGVIVGNDEDKGQPIVRVDTVNSGSAAERAGVREGDVILSANGIDVATFSDLKNVINELFPGDKLVLVVQRDGKEISLTVILDELKPETNASSPPGNYPEGIYPHPDDGTVVPFDPDTMVPFDPDTTFPPGLWDWWERFPVEMFPSEGGGGR